MADFDRELMVTDVREAFHEVFSVLDELCSPERTPDELREMYLGVAAASGALGGVIAREEIEQGRVSVDSRRDQKVYALLAGALLHAADQKAPGQQPSPSELLMKEARELFGAKFVKFVPEPQFSLRFEDATMP